MSDPKILSPEVVAYVQDYGVREHDVLARCRVETKAMGEVSGMQIAPEQGALMAMLVRLTGARTCLEVGVFTGYSALAVALALPEDGHITACDISEEYTKRAQAYWEAAGVGHKIALELAPAAQTLERLIAGGKAGQFDFAFIDADKPGYETYYQACMTLVRGGGAIVIDNVLWSGRVADPDASDEDTVALRRLNEKIKSDTRVDICLLPLRDGVTIVRKRGD